MNIYGDVRAGPDDQRTLLDLLTETGGEREGREELFQRTKRALQRHAAAEERFFYVPLFKDDKTQDKSRHSVAEHQELDEIIAELESTDRSSPGWLVRAKALADRVNHHLDEEEQEVFPISGKVLSESEKISLGEQYRRAMEEGST